MFLFNKNVKYAKMILVKYMSSRMDKYGNQEQVRESRTSRNKNIYNEIGEEDYDKLNLTNNISVIKTDADDLDIDTIKTILNEKYQVRENKSVERREDIDTEVNFERNGQDENTKEYDLKKVLETAHKNKTPNYDHERFEKLRETQYDILSSLNINRKEEPQPEESLSEEEANLMNLIKTVNLNAEKSKAIIEAQELSNSSDDLLGDLMGNEKTEVLEPVELDLSVEPDKKASLVEEIEKTKQLSKNEIEEGLSKYDDNTKNNEEKDDVFDDTFATENLSRTDELSNSFYTGKFQINDKDMDDFSDLEKEMRGGSLAIKVLVIILILLLIAGGIFLLNKYLNLGLF